MSKKSREVLVGQFESSRRVLRPEFNEVKINLSWGKIIKKLLKTKRK